MEYVDASLIWAGVTASIAIFGAVVLVLGQLPQKNRMKP